MVAAPPRPQLVVRKPPIWRRPLVWSIVGVLAAGGILAGVLVTLHNRSARNFKAREIALVEQYTGKLQSKLPPDATAVPPDLIAFYPNFTQLLQGLAAGKVKAADAISAAKQIQSTAQAAENGVGGLDLTKLIPAEFNVTGLSNQQSATSGTTGADEIRSKGATRQVLQDAQFLMSQSFELWRQAGSVMEQAAKADPAARKAMTTEAIQLTQEAGTLFDAGYRKVIGIRNALGLQAPTVPTQPPAASPSASASPSATASARPSASPSR
jgi:hypothetical protein